MAHSKQPPLNNVSMAEAELAFIDGWRAIAAPIYQTGVKAGFYSKRKKFNDAEKIALMHSELSEALEGLRGNLMDDKLPHRPMVEVELADCVIRIFNYSTHRGLDVAGAVVEKARFNATRPYKHGKKF
jgi:NTP pyrophosphatase (non-canonical NTP hydrolase)